jgi:hypothetical protein
MLLVNFFPEMKVSELGRDLVKIVAQSTVFVLQADCWLGEEGSGPHHRQRSRMLQEWRRAFRGAMGLGRMVSMDCLVLPDWVVLPGSPTCLGSLAS